MKNHNFIIIHALILTFFCTLSLQAQFTFDSNTPAAAANNIALDANITLNFSDNTKTASITAANIVITGRYTGIIAGAFSGGGTTAVVFNPTTNFKPGEVITLTLTAAVLNTADDVLTNPTSFSFTTKSALSAFNPTLTISDIADVTTSNSDTGVSGTGYALPVDIDGDGDMDLVSGNFKNQKISLHKNDGNANPSFTTTIIAEYNVTTKPRQAFAADIDNDGDMDIITLNANTGKDVVSIGTLKNNGDDSPWGNTFTYYDSRRVHALRGIPSIFMADIDNDGDVDLAVASANSSSSGYCMWFENTDGTFLRENAHPIQYNSGYKNSISLADIDNDGDIDAIVASSDTNTVSWYKNDGSADPTFSDQIDITTSATLAQAIYAADMDNDGDIDIIAVKENTISWYENDGSADPTFGDENIATGLPSRSYSELFHRNSIAISAADINNDGHMDILSSKSWYLNDGNANPSWTRKQFREGSNKIEAIYAADMDNDGDMDILATAYGDDKISWYKNSTTTTWDGSESNVWTAEDNWSNGIPNTNSDVTIANVDTGAALTTAASVKSITVNSGASFTSTGSSAGLSIATNFTNSGTTTFNSGSSIIVAGNATGNINYNRNIGSTNWQFISSPVSGQDIDAFIGAQSVAFGTDDNRGLSDYNNTTEAFTYWQAGTTNSGDFILGDGRAIKLSETEDITFTGTLSTENADIAITSNTNGFNLIGNPYPSYIAANTGADAVNNILTINDVDNDFLTEATLWFWDQSSDSYTQKNLASGAFYIAPGQGFFVSANGSKTFSFTEAMQSHQGTDTFLKTRTTRPEIKLTLTNGAAVKHSEIYYIEGTTTGFDNGYDSSIFEGSNQDFSLYTHAVANSTGRKLGIQSLPNSDFENTIIPLGLNANSGEEVTFSVNHQNLPSGLMVFIEDKKLKTITRLDQENSNYKITLDADSSKIGRFYMRTSTSDLRKTLDTKNFNIEQVSIYLSSDRNLRIAGLKSDTAILTVFNISGKEVYSKNLKSSETIDVTLSNSIIQGIYIIKLETNKGTINKKIFLK